MANLVCYGNRTVTVQYWVRKVQIAKPKEKTRRLARHGFGRITFFKKSGARLYIPQKIISDKNFPFRDGDIVKIEIGNSSLILKAVEWWEMLDWKTLPHVFEKLPEEMKEKIKKAGLL